VRITQCSICMTTAQMTTMHTLSCFQSCLQCKCSGRRPVQVMGCRRSGCAQHLPACRSGRTPGTVLHLIQTTPAGHPVLQACAPP
jgi:hypothetical protein